MKMNTNEWDLTKIPENIEIPSKFPGVEYSLTPHYLNIGFPSIVALWLLMTTLWGKVTCGNFPRNRGKLAHHIQLHEEWYPN